jgi:hypothetical protein
MGFTVVTPSPADLGFRGDLGALYRRGTVIGTSIRPCLAAIRTMHIRAGFTSPTDDPIIDSMRSGFCRTTANRVASRRSSMPLLAELALLACRKALRKSRPSTSAAIAVGFFLGLRPMSIHALYAEDINLKYPELLVRLHREKETLDNDGIGSSAFNSTKMPSWTFSTTYRSSLAAVPSFVTQPPNSPQVSKTLVENPRSFLPRSAGSPAAHSEVDALPRLIQLACPFHELWL